MEPEYLKWLRENKPDFYKQLQTDIAWSSGLEQRAVRADVDRAAAVELVRAMIADIPQSWLDPLLSGKTAQIVASPVCEIEALLTALRKRLQARAAVFLGERKDGEAGG